MTLRRCSESSAGARWFGARQGWTLTSLYNILHLTHNIIINRNVDLF